MDMLSQGLIAAATVLYLMSYFPMRRIFGYAFVFDIVITSGLIYMFAGSYAGMMTGVIAGLMISMVLRIGGWLFGREVLAMRRRKGNLIPEPIWMRKE